MALQHKPNGDFMVEHSPNDTVSQLKFNPTQHSLLMGSSWDKKCSVWEVQGNGGTVAKAQQTMEGPILCCDWAQDGQSAYMAGCDNKVKAWDLARNQMMDIGLHQAPVKCLNVINEINSVCTGSWDSTVKYWDMRTPKSQASVSLAERVYCMDMVYPLLVVGMAERKIAIFDIRKPTTPFRQLDSPLKLQTRCIAAFPNQQGFAIGSIEGRVGIHHVEEKDNSKNFAFKCHRSPEPRKDIFAVNCLAFHPYGTFATCGSDGIYTFWDKDAKMKLKQFEPNQNSITACTFNKQGNIFAYAVGYDWHKGCEYADKNVVNKIFLHAVKDNPGDSEIKPRAGNR